VNPIAVGLATIAAVGPTGFALIVWGSIALVAVVFGYVIWALFSDRQQNT